METSTQQARKGTNKKFLIALILLVVVGGGYIVYHQLHGSKFEETEDAQVEGNISVVIPRVSGYITEVRVKDNQLVKKGDTLVVLDDRDWKIKLEQAEAALAVAQSNLGVAESATASSQASVASAASSEKITEAQIEAAKVRVWRATQDYNRYAALVKDRSITQQQYEQALAEKETAEKQLQVLVEQARSANTQTHAVASQSNTTGKQVAVANAVIAQRVADVDAAKLNLSYTVIVAPVSGVINRVSLQPGQLVQPGQSLFNVVVDETLWVVANFKETQMTGMKLGQKVTVKVDALPGHEFEGQLTSFAPATGSRFALLPPDNASGNFVKTVQRIPVKIEFSKSDDSLLKQLRPGMNVLAEVHLN
ncbi:MAG TPA: HlyD family secretion protein [Phnomibacter sp.]|nr:HlyD family secretion protein [Phnomibacter sp.]